MIREVRTAYHWAAISINLESSRQVTSSHSPTPSLVELKRTRRQLDQNAQLLANRIKLLRMEDERTWKNIEQAHKKAKAILAAKKREEERLQEQQQHQREKERLAALQKERYNRLRDERRSVQGVAQQALLAQRQRAASALKQQSEMHRETRRQLSNYWQEQNQAKAKEIQNYRKLAMQRVEQHRSRKHAAIRDYYQRKYSEEDQLTRQREKDVMEMEFIEMELIKKLKSTQMLQQQAYDHLESAMSQEARMEADPKPE